MAFARIQRLAVQIKANGKDDLPRPSEGWSMGGRPREASNARRSPITLPALRFHPSFSKSTAPVSHSLRSSFASVSYSAPISHSLKSKAQVNCPCQSQPYVNIGGLRSQQLTLTSSLRHKWNRVAGSGLSKDDYFAEISNGFEEGLYFRLIDVCTNQL